MEVQFRCEIYQLEVDEGCMYGCTCIMRCYDIAGILALKEKRPQGGSGHYDRQGRTYLDDCT